MLVVFLLSISMTLAMIPLLGCTQTMKIRVLLAALHKYHIFLLVFATAAGLLACLASLVVNQEANSTLECSRAFSLPKVHWLTRSVVT